MKHFLSPAFLAICSCLFLFPKYGLALDYRHRLGIGYSNQLQNNVNSLSFKMQNSRSFAWGGMAGLNTDDSGGGFGVGLKAYRIFFSEPNLNFYGAILAGYLKEVQSLTKSVSGFQADLSLGTEFCIPGVKSLGFSIEFGASVTKLEEFRLQTVGRNFLTAGVHFYL